MEAGREELINEAPRAIHTLLEKNIMSFINLWSGPSKKSKGLKRIKDGQGSPSSQLSTSSLRRRPGTSPGAGMSSGRRDSIPHFTMQSSCLISDELCNLLGLYSGKRDNASLLHFAHHGHLNRCMGNADQRGSLLLLGTYGQCSAIQKQERERESCSKFRPWKERRDTPGCFFFLLFQ